MSKARRYREYAWVALLAPIRCPLRNTSQADFGAKEFLFFVEDGSFCIESKRTNAVVEVPFSQIREMRRKTEAELDADRQAEEKARAATEAPPS